MSKQLAVSYQKFKPKNLTFTELEENERSRQPIAFPRYSRGDESLSGAPLMLQCPWMKTASVPRPSEYYESDRDRAFIKLHLDGDSEEVALFRSKFEELDSIYNSATMRTTLFGKTGKKYKYYPMIHVPDMNEETGIQRPPFLKIKLDIEYESEKVKSNVYISTLKGSKRERVRAEVSTVDEFGSIVRYMSDIRPIIRPVKLWASKKKEFGIIWKLVKTEVEPRAGASSSSAEVNDWSNNDDFLDTDDDDDDDDDIVQSVGGAAGATEVDDDLDIDEADDIEESSDVVVTDTESESEEEVVVKPKAKANAKRKTKGKSKSKKAM